MNDLEKIGPELSKCGKDNPFVVPEGYFDSLPSRVQEYCQKETVKNQQVKWYAAVKPQLAFAVGFCFLAFLAITGYYFLKPIGQAKYFDRVDYMKVVVESGTDFDEMQLYDAVCNENKKDTVKKLEDNKIIDYYFYNNPDYVTLMDHSKDIKP